MQITVQTINQQLPLNEYSIVDFQFKTVKDGISCQRNTEHLKMVLAQYFNDEFRPTRHIGLEATDGLLF